MSELKMIAPPVKNVPWQERPANLTEHRSQNIRKTRLSGRNPVEGVARIFNSATVQVMNYRCIPW